MRAAACSPTDPRALILLVVLTLVWGTNWPLFPLAVREVSVWTFRAIALPVAGAILLGAAAARGQSLTIPREHWWTVVAASLFYLVVWNIASTYAAVLIPSGQAAVLGFTMPLWSALISTLLLGDRLGLRMLLALVFGAASVTLVGTLILKRRPVPVPAMVLTGWQLLIAAVPIAAGAVSFGDGHWFVPSWQSVAVIAYITLVPIAIGNACWFAIVGMLPPNVAGLSSIMVPVVALVSGAAIHGEPFGVLQWLAMGCCAASLWLALLAPRRR